MCPTVPAPYNGERGINVNETASKFLAEDDFWKIILVSLDGTDSVGLVQDRQQQLLERELQHLSYDEFTGFLGHFWEKFWAAYRNDLWALAYVVMGGCSDDCFTDFRTWLVTRGKSVFVEALRSPDSLCDEFNKIPAGDIPLWEYNFEQQFDVRFGDDQASKIYEQYNFGLPELRDPENQWSSDDEATMKKQCPIVFEKHWGKWRF